MLALLLVAATSWLPACGSSSRVAAPVAPAGGRREPVVPAAVAAVARAPSLAIVATDVDFADGLAASAAASARGASVVLTPAGALGAAAADALRRSTPDSILVLGGEAAVGRSVLGRLDEIAPGRVARIAGRDRFDTAARLAERLFPDRVRTVYVASGHGFADALAAGPVAGRAGAPILLVTADAVPAATAAALQRLRPDEIRVLGGPSVVGDQVTDALGRLAPRVVRIGGSDRYDTAVALSRVSFPTGSRVAYLAAGDDYAGALVAGPRAAADGAPLLLVEPSCLPPAVRDELDRLGGPRLVVLGDDAAARRLELGAVCTAPLAAPSPPPPAPPAPSTVAPRPLPPITASGLARGARIGLGPIETYGFAAHVGADLLDAHEAKLCSPTPDCTYWGLQNVHTDGSPELGGIPITIRGVHMARLELYPDLVEDRWDTNDNWDPNLTVGGLHLWNPDGRPIFHLRLPHRSNGAVRYFGRAVERGLPVADGRLRTQVFQVVPKNATAGAFNISSSRSGLWTGGWLWPGLYELFFFDDLTGHAIQTRGVLDPATPITVDLAEACFGFPACTVLS